MPAVSVILPSFNHAPFLKDAIESILNQHFQDLELIIWDDASADDSWKIIQSYHDIRIRAFQNSQRLGPVFGVNKAIFEMAHGRYIAIHRSDAVLESSTLQKQVGYLEAHPEIGAVFTNTQVVDERGSPLARPATVKHKTFTPSDHSSYEWLRHCFLDFHALGHPNALIRRRCYDDCGPYLDMLDRLSDLDMWVKLCSQQEICVLPDRLGKVRIQDMAMTASEALPSTSIRWAYEYGKILRQYRNIIDSKNVFEIFPDYDSYDRGKDTDPEYVLARACLESDEFLPRRRLGIEILVDIYNNPLRRQSVEKHYGVCLHDAISITEPHDILAHECLPAPETLARDQTGQIVELKQSIADRDGQIDALSHAVDERNERISALENNVRALIGSTSWKLTAPIRAIKKNARRLKYLLSVFPEAIRQGGGYRASFGKAMSVLQREGIAGIKWRLRRPSMQAGRPGCIDDFGPKELKGDYKEWIERYDTLDQEACDRIRSRIQRMPRRPRVSVIMPVYDPPLHFLERAISSVQNQLYPDWQLCIADDCSTNPKIRELLQKYASADDRISVVFRDKNGHISEASNSARKVASGEFIAMLDHDDEISPHALYLIAEELNSHPDADFIYTDQDKIDEKGVRYDPYFKPDFNLDLLRSQNYVDHLAVFRTSIVEALGGWRSDFDGSQDYDLVLRVIERTEPSRIRHLPYVLYHWRAVVGSLAADASAKNYAASRSRKALKDHLKRVGVQAEVTSDYPNLSIHRVTYPVHNEPLVTVIIPTRDGKDILSQCLDGLLHRTDYRNFEIIIVNNQSQKKETIEYLHDLSKDSRISVLSYDGPFNYSKINNMAVRQARGEILAFLNNDIDVISSDWLREMVSHAMRHDIGAVGARLYYPDNTVQHAGVLLGYKGRAGHMYRYAPRHWLGYWARGVLTQNLTAVTAACMVVRKEVFDSVGGFDEEHLSVTFNDVDLCLRIHELGYRNIYAPRAELYHHESKTRGMLAFQAEEDFFARKWATILRADPAYNPNLSLEYEDFSLAFPPRVIHPWLARGLGLRLGDSPLVSIITRTYGSRQEFLRNALLSIFNQTYRPIEVVVVEDGTEHARDLIAGMTIPEGLSVVYESLPKRGRCFVGNRGLQLSNGAFFGFLDDDDRLMPEHVESLVRCLCFSPSSAGAYSSSVEVPTDVISLSPLRLKEGGRRVVGRADFSLNHLWNYNYIAIQSFLLRRELFERHGGFSEDLDCLEDWDLWLRYSAEADFVFLDKVTSEFRVPADQAKLDERAIEHRKYLPVLRERQRRLVAQYLGTPYYHRLRSAWALVPKDSP